MRTGCPLLNPFIQYPICLFFSKEGLQSADFCAMKMSVGIMKAPCKGRARSILTRSEEQVAIRLMTLLPRPSASRRSSESGTAVDGKTSKVSLGFVSHTRNNPTLRQSAIGVDQCRYFTVESLDGHFVSPRPSNAEQSSSLCTPHWPIMSALCSRTLPSLSLLSDPIYSRHPLR